MGKRSTFERRKNDLYETWDPRAVKALLPHLKPGTTFVEPCAGSGVLADQLMAAGMLCIDQIDIEPLDPCVDRNDALECDWSIYKSFDCFITNPPWTRSVLHKLIVHLSDQRPTWLLFDADWKYTRQSTPYMARCRNIVPVGRLKWIPDSPYDGKDNCAWYLFDKPNDEPARFYARAA
jgi:hypothetical protein